MPGTSPGRSLPAKTARAAPSSPGSRARLTARAGGGVSSAQARKSPPTAVTGAASPLKPALKPALKPTRAQSSAKHELPSLYDELRASVLQHFPALAQCIPSGEHPSGRPHALAASARKGVRARPPAPWWHPSSVMALIFPEEPAPARAGHPSSHTGAGRNGGKARPLLADADDGAAGARAKSSRPAWHGPPPASFEAYEAVDGIELRFNSRIPIHADDARPSQPKTAVSHDGGEGDETADEGAPGAKRAGLADMRPPIGGQLWTAPLSSSQKASAWASAEAERAQVPDEAKWGVLPTAAGWPPPPPTPSAAASTAATAPLFVRHPGRSTVDDDEEEEAEPEVKYDLVA
ncbi:hypothetical protein KFE25_002966 [Diacronema lutheri]|uniref:Uncharacterized protein n=1 Tax=Diacronema lutheri TaxID=2081491 RepID=A0A8J5XLX2_DIALT|nr:hypothetical protein KFE25_002966 [Diacronema lutheri]